MNEKEISRSGIHWKKLNCIAGSTGMLLKRGMGNGEWGMGNGEWEKENGKWKMGNWKWEIEYFFALTFYNVE